MLTAIPVKSNKSNIFFVVLNGYTNNDFSFLDNVSFTNTKQCQLCYRCSSSFKSIQLLLKNCFTACQISALALPLVQLMMLG